MGMIGQHHGMRMIGQLEGNTYDRSATVEGK